MTMLWLFKNALFTFQDQVKGIETGYTIAPILFIHLGN